MSDRFGVAYGPLSQEILAGRVVKAGDHFTSKNAATDEALAAVGQYVRDKYDGCRDFIEIETGHQPTVARLDSIIAQCEGGES